MLTDLRGSSALLGFAAPLSGRLYIRNESGRLVAELHKQSGETPTLALEPGDYQITLDGDAGRRRGVVTVAPEAQSLVLASMLAPVTLERVALRGGASSPNDKQAPEPPAAPAQSEGLPAAQGFVDKPFSFAIGKSIGLSISITFGEPFSFSECKPVGLSISITFGEPFSKPKRQPVSFT